VTGFLEKKSGPFCAELWSLLIDAEKQEDGIPSLFVLKKKEELLAKQPEQLKTIPLPKEVNDYDDKKVSNSQFKIFL
jgi:hypothetical protein